MSPSSASISRWSGDCQAGRFAPNASLEVRPLLDVDYHPTGYPTRISLDHSFTTADDEFVHTASSLRPLVPE